MLHLEINCRWSWK